ncbi:MAG TPA: hypothetical protein VHG91_15465 [Longimicrobium sp.]|nr:hypothetical protein [Longimicrobium sp.]
MIVCLEGPSAVGKTTLLGALARERGAATLPELDAGAPPPPGSSAAWFADQSAERWGRAVDRSEDAPLVVLDGDPLKGLWYNGVFADEGWEGVDVVAPLYRARIEAGALAFPDLYVVLAATEPQLRARRAADPTRTRRNFEKHLRLVAPLRRYFAALREAEPPRVLFLDTDDRDRLVDPVIDAIRALPPGPPDSLRLLDHITAWLRAHPDASAGS